jgi:hypothetical protein
VLQAAAVALLVGAGAGALDRSVARWSGYRTELSTARGHLRVLARHAPLVRLIHQLERSPPGTRLVAVPCGATVQFMAGLDSDEPLTSFLPMELPTPSADRALAERLAARAPEYVLRSDLDLTEFGVRGFGAGYAEETRALLDRRYLPVDRAGPQVTLLRLAGGR